MSTLIQACLRFTATAFVVGGILNIAGITMAIPPGSPSVPEIDPSSAASALAVLAGGGLMLAERFGFRRR